ncbi:3-methyl-2-oxobutanoate hydroxymethyltransferase, partial [Candidatus Bathyarchaeota archaeon]|nr:3-methyl-2-oxobutanoate hydroxymethyltransferase [Candidatus Bathyarchaeota archaeon]NIV44910.1 3-methyl-2-oxobutanoate hydroxymethyltransferase [Candidatus Bathyarchaeota archaeon]
RGATNTPIVGDMPIKSDRTARDALRNAKRFIEAGAQGVKIEGKRSKVVRTLLNDGIPVMGHVGLLPQTAENYRVKGKRPPEAEKIFHDALELDELGV